MDKKIINRRRVIILSCCVLLAAVLAIVLWPDSGLEEDIANTPPAQNTALRDPDQSIIEPTPTPPPVVRIAFTEGDLGGDFYDIYPIERDGGLHIFRVLAQTREGDMLAVVLPEGWPPFELPQLPQHLARVSPDFETITPIFNEPPPWERFHFAVADSDGFIYVLGESADGRTTLHIYDINGNETAQHEWAKEYSRSMATGVQIAGNVIILQHGNFVSMITTEGEVLFGEPHTFLEGTPAAFTVYGAFIDGVQNITVGDDHLYLLFTGNGGGYRMQKMAFPSMNILWDEPLPRYFDTPFAMAYDKNTYLLYFRTTPGLYAFDEKNWSVKQAKNLWETEMYREFFLREPDVVFMTRSFFITDGGHLHMVVNYDCCATHINEWVVKRLEGEEAETRQDEIRQELADRDFISIADMSRHSTHDHLRELARRQDILLNLDTLGNGGSLSYVELLIAALYGGNAQWDMIALPLRLVDLPRLVEAGLLANILDFVGPERFSDDSMYYANFFTHSKIDGALYFIPHLSNVPVLLVSNDYPGLDALRTLSLTWTWADFLYIAQNIYTETGIPPISAPDAFKPDAFSMWSIPLSNVPPFYLYNEDVLFNIANDREAFSQTLDLYKTLTSSAYNMDSGQEGVFTFSEWGLLNHTLAMEERGMDFSRTHTVLPLPTMYGERPFSFGSVYAFLQSGQHVEQAIAIAVEYFDIIGTDTPQATAFRAFSSATRPSAAAIQHATAHHGFHYAPERLFAEDAAIRSMANARLSLPWSVTEPIQETAESFVHGVVSLEYAVERIADIMWLYMNE